jgi:uncharacterized membrane protein
MNTDLTIFTFNSTTGAEAMLKTLQDLQNDNFIEIMDAVTVIKDSAGHVQVYQPLEIGPGKGAAFGALTGTIVGLLGGPSGALVGLVSGAVTGGAAAAVIESGLPQDDIRAMAVDELRPGESALMVYVDEVWMDQLEDAARSLDAAFARHMVREEQKLARGKAAELRQEKIDAAYKDWQAKVDNLRKNAEALRQQAITGLQADQAAIQAKLNSANAALHKTYENMLQTLQAWKHQIDADIDTFEAEAKAARSDAKAQIDRRIAVDQEARAAVRAHVKDTLTARQNSLKADLERLQAQAAQAQGQVKADLGQRVAKLQADWDAEQKRIDQLDEAEGAAFDQMVKSIEEAYTSYRSAVDEAETKYAKSPDATSTGSGR